MIHRTPESTPDADEPTAADVAPLHVFDQTNGVLGKVEEKPGPETPDHSARNSLTAGAVMNPGGGF